MKISEVCPSIGQVLGFSVPDSSERIELCDQSKYQSGDPTDMEDNVCRPQLLRVLLFL